MSLKVEKGLFQQKLTWWPSKVQVKGEEKLQAIKLYLQDVYYILQKDNNREEWYSVVLKQFKNWIKLDWWTDSIANFSQFTSDWFGVRTDS